MQSLSIVTAFIIEMMMSDTPRACYVLCYAACAMRHGSTQVPEHLMACLQAGGSVQQQIQILITHSLALLCVFHMHQSS